MTVSTETKIPKRKYRYERSHHQRATMGLYHRKDRDGDEHFDKDPCDKCGHNNKAHCDRNGVNECLIKGCEPCRDHSIITLAVLCKILGLEHCYILRAVERSQIELLYNAEDMLAIHGTDLQAMLHTISKRKKRDAEDMMDIPTLFSA